MNLNYDSILDTLIDGGYLPEFVIRRGIRSQLQQRLSLISSTNLTDAYETKVNYVDLLRTRPIAIETDKANEQHYEVGTGVLQAMLGPRMKYSCALYPNGGETLAQAEMAMLEICGWGSLCLYLAEIFPNSHITAFSNSATQKSHILSQAARKSLTNLDVITGDISTYSFTSSGLENTFDRVLSVELFEHMKNYSLLLSKISVLLKPAGKLFVHLFAHKTTPYDFDTGWMTQHFFTGGTMPSADLLLYFAGQGGLTVRRLWWVNGVNYAKTCEEWLSNMRRNRKDMWPHLIETYASGQEFKGRESESEREVWKWFHRWEVFYMACAELFNYNNGEEWGVCHYLFEKGADAT